MKNQRWVFFLVLLILFGCINAQNNPASLNEINKQFQSAKADGKPVNLDKIIPGLFKDTPAEVKKVFGDSFSLISAHVIEKKTIPSVKNIKGVEYKGRGSFGGSLKIGNISVEAMLNVYEDEFKNNRYSFVIELPKNYKISQIIPQLKALDNILSLPRPQFVFSDFNYISKDGVFIAAGLNYISLIDLKGPFKLFGELKNKASGLKSIIVDMDAPIQLAGKLPLTLSSFSFTINIPIRLGIDLQQIKQIPSGFSDFLQKITTDNFIATLTLALPQTIKISVQNGIQITFGTQKEPIKLQTFGGINLIDQAINFGAKIPSTIEMGWLALSGVGIEFIIDPTIQAALAAVGIPISGLGLTGQIELGKQVSNRTSLELTTMIKFTKSPNIIFDVVGKNLDFSNLVYLISQIVAKAKGKSIPEDSIPTIKLNKVEGKLAPWTTMVAGKLIEAGFRLGVDAILFDQSFGLLVDINQHKISMSAKGWMPPIKVAAGDKTIFQLTGAGKDLKWNTPDDSPYVHFHFEPATGPSFAISTLLEMPDLALKSKVDILFAKHRFNASLESSALGFGAMFDLVIDPVKWKEMKIDFRFKNDFDQFLAKQTVPVLKKMHNKMTKIMEKIDADMAKLSAEMAKAQQTGVSKTEQEIQKTRNTIAIIDNKIRALKKKCKKKPITCIKAGFKIAAQETAKTAQKAYLETLLKPAKQTVKTVTGVAHHITKGIADSKLRKKMTQTALNTMNKIIQRIGKGVSIFSIKEARGGVSLPELMDGKIPHLKKLVIEVNLPGQKKTTISLTDVAFNFKKPFESAQEIASKLLKPSIKVG